MQFHLEMARECWKFGKVLLVFVILKKFQEIRRTVPPASLPFLGSTLTMSEKKYGLTLEITRNSCYTIRNFMALKIFYTQECKLVFRIQCECCRRRYTGGNHTPGSEVGCLSSCTQFRKRLVA